MISDALSMCPLTSSHLETDLTSLVLAKEGADVTMTSAEVSFCSAECDPRLLEMGSLVVVKPACVVVGSKNLRSVPKSKINVLDLQIPIKTYYHLAT